MLSISRRLSARGSAAATWLARSRPVDENLLEDVAAALLAMEFARAHFHDNLQPSAYECLPGIVAELRKRLSELQ
jgi:hypothetical protein